MYLSDMEMVALVKLIGATRFRALVSAAEYVLASYTRPNKRHVVFVDKLLTMSALFDQYTLDRQSLTPAQLAEKWR